MLTNLKSSRHIFLDTLKKCWSHIWLYEFRFGKKPNAYHTYQDPDVCVYAGRVRDYYHGYPYVIACDISMYDWCDKNCTGRFRTGIHSVTESRYITGDWDFDEMGGSDIFFYAFKQESDFIMFCLSAQR